MRVFDVDRIAVDRTTLRVVSPGTRYELPDGTIPETHVHSQIPLPVRKPHKTEIYQPEFKDLTGDIIGHLKVIGLTADYQKRWVVRCCCGIYEIRRAKVLKNYSKNYPDKCFYCRRKDTANRQHEFITNGFNSRNTPRG